jgi:hypothetical protein
MCDAPLRGPLSSSGIQERVPSKQPLRLTSVTKLTASLHLYFRVCPVGVRLHRNGAPSH